MTELPVHFLNDAPVPAAGPADRGMIARQAIVNGMQQIIGYELFNRSRAYPDHTAASDVSLVFTALSHAGEEDLVGTKLMFVNCTHEAWPAATSSCSTPTRSCWRFRHWAWPPSRRCRPACPS
jgi:EAL and modified HD-GYP domain-containing signal transduction protein